MSHFYDVDVYRHVDEEDGEVWWLAEGGPVDDLSMGLDFESTQDLQGLVLDIEDETAKYRRASPDLRVRFFEGNRQPAIEFRAALKEAGVALPEWVAP